ncbi:MAG: sigma-70 family RNA polymerase sigma factor [Oscillospiraceae bacterium]|nr:sigma-70 family RNA polymerase sigma factor [Oscillospiraceae bacterium]
MPDNLSQLTDEELAVLSKTSVEAETELLSRYFRLIRFHAGRYAAVSADAEDLTQEGLITLLRVMKQFNPEQETKFSSFAQVCIINRMRSLVRRQQNADVPDEDLIRNLEEKGSFIDPDTPESILIEKESYADCCMQVMALLSDKEWEVLQCVLDGLSYAHTAELLGISIKSVDNAMQRIRRKMRAVHSPDSDGKK